jgi:hypothetical protein
MSYLKKPILTISLLLLVAVIPASAAYQIDIAGPPDSGNYGQQIVFLPNGNLVVTDPAYGESDSGAVYLYNGGTGTLISTLKGSSSGDNVGGGTGIVTVLKNGDFVVTSPHWSKPLEGGGRIFQVGAATYCSANTGCDGFVSETNSIIGTVQNDQVGSQVVPLDGGNFVVISQVWGLTGAVTWRSPAMGTSGLLTTDNSLIGAAAGVKVLSNGNYLIFAPTWSSNRGAVRLCSGSAGCTGTISAANSLVGTNELDQVATTGILELPNGNCVVISHRWNGARGAVTFFNTTTGTTGEVSPANSLVGIDANQSLGSSSRVKILANGNYAVLDPGWRNPINIKVGAVTVCSGAAGCFGNIQANNAVTGAAADDLSSSIITPLTNGNFVLSAPNWDGGPGNTNDGAVTLISGALGTVGQVSLANSLVGVRIIENPTTGNIIPLSSGNYVVTYSFWNSSRGAATFGSGTTGVVGPITPENSLTGAEAGDRIGGDNGVFTLANGNYVVRSYSSDQQKGAVTWCSGTTGCTNMVPTLSNSLVGSIPLDRVGYPGIIPLPNGHYVILSDFWNHLGALTWGNGVNGSTVGPVSASNSFLGDGNFAFSAFDRVKVLSNGNYVVNSPFWDGSRGAVTWGSGTGALTGNLSAATSLVGTTASDSVGNRNVIELPNQRYVIWSPLFDGGGMTNSGALTFARPDRPIMGEINGNNSFLGTAPNGGEGLTSVYDPVRKQIAIRRAGPIITLYRFGGSLFDYDGDGKADISVFRPSEGNWYIQNSGDGSVIGPHFGQTSDLTAPGDFDGDGKADISVYRPSEGNWYRLNSSDGSFFGTHFGAFEDKPAVGDFDGDGKADISVFRPSEGNWYRLNSGDGSFFGTHFGATEDKPAVGDFDGDGKADISLFRPSEGNWYRLNSTDGSFFGTHFGITEDRPTPADYDGDGKTDISVFRPSAGDWYRLNSDGGSFFGTHFGAMNDKPVSADFDGDGKADIAVFRPSEGNWYILNSTAGFLSQHFGATEDTPTPNSFIY